MKTNCKTDSPNAITWGVFPGKEIVQPTVIELGAFMAWKDDAFELWSQWASVYSLGSSSYTLLNYLGSSYHLVNLVDNNFYSQYALYDLLDLVHLRSTSAGASNLQVINAAGLISGVAGLT